MLIKNERLSIEKGGIVDVWALPRAIAVGTWLSAGNSARAANT
ncbi:hypothetical protein [uncultured Imperialibacter sp.]